MPDYTNIKPALAAWVASVTSLRAIWLGTKEMATWKGNHIMLDVTSDRSLGYSVLSEYDSQAASGSEITQYVEEHFSFNFEMQARTFRATPGYDAAYYTNLLRNSLKLKASRITWRTAKISFARVLNSTFFSTPHDGRERSYATLEVAVNAFDRTSNPADTYIATAATESEILGPDGNPLDHQVDTTIQVS
jgi:hypothetical protein